MDPLDVFMATLSADDGERTAATTTADARLAARSYRSRQSQAATAVASTDVVVRNRRYTKLQQLLQANIGGGEEDEYYFSDAMMQQRNPALFHLHFGQYRNVASQKKKMTMFSEGVTLSSFLMDTCERQVLEARRVEEQRTWGEYHFVDDVNAREEEEEEEGDDDEEEEEEEEEETKQNNEQEEPSLEWRRAQLIELMSQRFLDGCDVNDVDYAGIDVDEALDDMEQIQRDAEERYFDSMDS